MLSKLIVHDSETDLADFLEDRRHALVPYRKPGVNLAESVKEVLQHCPDVDVLLLANHGIVVAAKTVEDLSERLEELLSSLPAPERHTSAERTIALPPLGFRAVDDEMIHDLAFDEQAFNIAKYAWAITPDHVVFLGAKSNTFDSAKEFERSSDQPPFAIIRNSGVYLNNLETPTSSLIEEMLSFFRDVTMRVTNQNAVRALSHSEVTELLDWEAEKYRQTLNNVGGN